MVSESRFVITTITLLSSRSSAPKKFALVKYDHVEFMQVHIHINPIEDNIYKNIYIK